MNNPPPYSDITGISRAVMKDNAQESLVNYDGNARPGELVVDLTIDPPTLYVGNNQGNLTLVSTGGGGGGNLGNLTISNVTIGTVTADNPIIVQPVQIQQPWWYALYGDLGVEIGDDYGEGVAQDSTGNVYVVGGDGNLGVISFLIKYDSQGTLLWQKTFDVAGSYKSGESVVVDLDDNVYASFYDWGNTNSCLVKLDPTGTILWQKKISGVQAGQVAVDSANNVYFCTFSNSPSARTVLFKFDTLGNLSWQKEYIGSTGTGVSVDSNDDIYLTNIAVLKLDSSGTIIYQVEGLSAFPSGSTIGDSAGNSYIALGDKVQKLDTLGNSVWLTTLTGISFYTVAYDTTTNSIIATGESPDGGGNLFVASLDSATGNLNWINSFGSVEYEGQYYSYAPGFLSVNNGIAVITGYSYSTGASNANAITLAVPTNGQGQGVYGSFSYLTYVVTPSTVTGSTTPAAQTVQTSTETISAGDLVVSSNSYTNSTYEFSPGGALSFEFSTSGASGSLIFPDGTSQQTALELGMNYTFGNLTTTNITTNRIYLNNTKVSLGLDAGKTNQGTPTVAIGQAAGQTNQNAQAVAVGPAAGSTNQSGGAVAVGLGAGTDTQGTRSIAIGPNSGSTSQGQEAVAIGYLSGQNTQGAGAVAIGLVSGQTSQGATAIAIGQNSGINSQGASAVAIGYYSGDTQKTKAVAIGAEAAYSNQGASAVAVGFAAGRNNQANNSIVINATGAALNNTTANTFVVKPVREVTGGVAPVGFSPVYYNPTTGEFIVVTP